MGEQEVETDDLRRFHSGEFSQTCDHCGADAGERCRTPNGRATYTHGNRWRKVSPANTVGYAQGLRDALRMGPDATRQQFDWIVKRLESMREEGRL
jgi:hypothetical protein